MLRPVLDSDLPIFFEQERDETARQMAAFVPKDPNDREAFDAQWRRMRSSDRILVRTIVVDSEVVGHVASFDRDDEHEVTYWIGREYWGRGIASPEGVPRGGHRNRRFARSATRTTPSSAR